MQACACQIEPCPRRHRARVPLPLASFVAATSAYLARTVWVPHWQENRKMSAGPLASSLRLLAAVLVPAAIVRRREAQSGLELSEPSVQEGWFHRGRDDSLLHCYCLRGPQQPCWLGWPCRVECPRAVPASLACAGRARQTARAGWREEEVYQKGQDQR